MQLSVHGCPHIAGHVRVWAQFQQASEADSFCSGQIIPSYGITHKERTKQFPMMPWLKANVFPGDVVFDSLGFEALTTNTEESGVMTILINSELMGWHYHWVSNKHTCDTPHVLRTYFFVVTNDNDLKCIGTFSSPGFQIFCRKRPKNNASSKEPLQISDALFVAKPGPKKRSNCVEKDPRALKMRRRETSSNERTQTLMKLIRYIFISGSRSMGELPVVQSVSTSSLVTGLDNFTSSLFGSVICGLDYDFDFFNSSSEEKNQVESISRDLAQYLVEEETFTASISKFFQEASMKEITPESSMMLFKQFTDLVSTNVSSFLAEKGLSMASLENELNEKVKATPRNDERLFHEEDMVDPSAPSDVRMAFLSRLQREKKEVEFDMSKAPPPEYDVNGVWFNTGENEQVYTEAIKYLSEYGYPVLMVQMMRRMFFRFTAILSSEYLLVRGSRKLMSKGEYVFKLDNVDHQIDFRDMSLGLPLSPCMYRAGFSSENGFPVVRLLIHGYLPKVAHARYEVDRTFGLNHDGSLLSVTFQCSIIRATGRKQSLGSFNQDFYKVCDEKELNELLQFTADLF